MKLWVFKERLSVISLVCISFLLISSFAHWSGVQDAFLIIWVVISHLTWSRSWALSILVVISLSKILSLCSFVVWLLSKLRSLLRSLLFPSSLRTEKCITNTASNVPLIRGCLFLATANALIYGNEMARLSFGNMTLESNVFNMQRQPFGFDDIYFLLLQG